MDLYKLIDYFNGKYTNDDLPQVLTSDAPFVVDADDAEIIILPEHLTRVCDAVLEGKISPCDLESIGSCIIFSDLFEYDTDTEAGNRVADVIFWWENPYINYLLIHKTVEKFKLYLKTGKNTLTDEDLALDRHSGPRK